MWVGAAGLCVNERGRVLLVLQGGPGQDKGWAIPGGGVQPGETLEDCCRREVWEETGYRVCVHRKVHVKTGSPLIPGGRFELYVFEAVTSGGEPSLHDPDGLIHDVRWFDAAEVGTAPFMFPEDQDLVLRYLGAAPDPPIATAGAYVVVDQRIPFVIGPTADGVALAIVRVGGHRQEGESAWDCVRRKAFEEAGIRINPVRHARWTYRAIAGTPQPVLVGRDLAPGGEGREPPPLLVMARRDRTQPTSVMYLAISRDEPVPGPEAKGLVLLRRSDVVLLCDQTLTLRQFAEMGGTAKLREPLEPSLPLWPFGQLRLLRDILADCPSLLPG